MQFNSTLAEDRKSHDKFHKADHNNKAAKQPVNPEGVVNLMDTYVDGAHHQIRVIDCHSPDLIKEHAKKVFSVSDNDLGRLVIHDHELWREIPDPHNPTDPNKVPQYKLYLYLIDYEVVSYIQAERIRAAGEYYYGQLQYTSEGWDDYAMAGIEEDQEFVYADTPYKVYMSVERVWTRADKRRQGLASKLIDYARKDFVTGLELSKKEIAFSRPTTMGNFFAKAYTHGAFETPMILSNLDVPCPVVFEGCLIEYGIWSNIKYRKEV